MARAIICMRAMSSKPIKSIMRVLHPKGVKRVTKGTVKRWLGGRGYGFIRPEGKREDVFVHSSDLQGAAYLREGEKVEFNIEDSPRGPRAVNVKPVSS
jgi:CspA family cold shock protein